MTRKPLILTRGLTAALAATGCIAMAASAFGQSNVDPAHQFAWQENCGWLNWHDADGGVQGVRVDASILSGFIWAENVGWINVGDGTPAADCAGRPCYGNTDGADFGVNVDPDGTLRGLAWGENVGWINLDDTTHFVALGPACAAGDLACDGVIGLSDYAALGEVLMGPDIPVDCPVFDFDTDGDVDLADFAEWLVVFGG